MNALDWLARWERRHLVLLVSLVLMLLLQPIAHQVTAGWMIYEALSAVIVLAVLLLVFETRADRIIALVLAVPGLVFEFARYAVPGAWEFGFAAAFHVSSMVFFGFAAALILREILERRAVRADDVLGALCSYLLLGLAWASLYQLIELVAPGSFSINSTLTNDAGNLPSREGIFVYFSFVTLTTLGYGDVTPVSHIAATFAWLEATFGQFYIAVVVAQVVGFRLANAGSRRLGGSGGD